MQADIQKAFIKVGIGAEKRSRIISEKEKKITAFHEAGHAILFHVLPDVGPVHTVSIIPTGTGAAGYTMPLPEKDEMFNSKGRMLQEIIVDLGGRVAEELVFDDITTGASQDIKQATQMAQCIYCGMMTDTGAFTYNSNAPAVYLIISHLLEKGVDKDRVYNRVYNNYSPQAIKFRSYVIFKKLRVLPASHAAYYTVTRDEMRRFQFVRGDLEGVVNIPQKIKKLKLSISLREDTEKDQVIRVSLRSGNGFHCRKMAEEFFHGGGHEDAAGGRLECSIEEAEQVVLRAIMAYKEQLR